MSADVDIIVQGTSSSPQLTIQTGLTQWSNIPGIPSGISLASTFGTSLLDSASASAAKSLLAITTGDVAGLGSAATQNTSAFDVAGAAAAAISTASADATIKANNAVTLAENYSVQRANHTGTQPASTITGLASVATSGLYSSLSGAPNLSAVATSGSYTDLSNRPTLGTAASQNSTAFDAAGAATAAQSAAISTAAADATTKANAAQSAAISTASADATTKANAAAAASIPLTTKGAVNGVASLDSSGKVPVAQLPSTLMQYVGTWNAATNTPTLSNGTGTSGYVYNVSVAGTALGYTWNVGDWAVYNGTKWEQSPGTDEVVSVAGKAGIVTLNTSDVSENATNLYFTTSRASAAAPVQSVAGRTGAVTLSSSDISGLGTAAAQNTSYFDLAGAAAAAQSAAISTAATDATTKANAAISTAEAYSIQRANHTGTQPASTITGLATVATSGAYSSLSGTPSLSAVATSGSYNDLSNKPTLGSAAAQNTSYFDLAGAASSAAAASVPLNTKGAANGVASLDSGGKVPITQLPSSLMQYLGVWNASLNSPTLANGTGVSGSVYNCTTAGTANFGAGNITFNVGDWVIYNGTKWEQSPGSDEVVSVAGKTGVVTLTTSDVSEGSNLYFTNSRAAAAAPVQSVNGSGGAITNVVTTSTTSPASPINQVVTMTSAAYIALGASVSPTTLYVIVG